jgi:hypothetical protein
MEHAVRYLSAEDGCMSISTRRAGRGERHADAERQTAEGAAAISISEDAVTGCEEHRKQDIPVVIDAYGGVNQDE